MSPVLKEQIVCFHKERINKSEIAKITQYDRSMVFEKIFEIMYSVIDAPYLGGRLKLCIQLLLDLKKGMQSGTESGHGKIRIKNI